MENPPYEWLSGWTWWTFSKLRTQTSENVGQGRYHQWQVVLRWPRAVLQAQMVAGYPAIVELAGIFFVTWQGPHCKWWLVAGTTPNYFWSGNYINLPVLFGMLMISHDCFVAFILALPLIMFAFPQRSSHTTVQHGDSDCPKWAHVGKPRLPTRVCVLCIICVCIRMCVWHVCE